MTECEWMLHNLIVPNKPGFEDDNEIILFLLQKVDHSLMFANVETIDICKEDLCWFRHQKGSLLQYQQASPLEL